MWINTITGAQVADIVALLSKQTDDQLLRHLKGNTKLQAFRLLIVDIYFLRLLHFFKTACVISQRFHSVIPKTGLKIQRDRNLPRNLAICKGYMTYGLKLNSVQWHQNSLCLRTIHFPN